MSDENPENLDIAREILDREKARADADNPLLGTGIETDEDAAPQKAEWLKKFWKGLNGIFQKKEGEQ